MYPGPLVPQLPMTLPAPQPSTTRPSISSCSSTWDEDEWATESAATTTPQQQHSGICHTAGSLSQAVQDAHCAAPTTPRLPDSAPPRLHLHTSAAEAAPHPTPSPPCPSPPSAGDHSRTDQAAATAAAPVLSHLHSQYVSKQCLAHTKDELVASVRHMLADLLLQQRTCLPCPSPILASSPPGPHSTLRSTVPALLCPEAGFPPPTSPPPASSRRLTREALEQASAFFQQTAAAEADDHDHSHGGWPCSWAAAAASAPSPAASSRSGYTTSTVTASPIHALSRASSSSSSASSVASFASILPVMPALSFAAGCPAFSGSDWPPAEEPSFCPSLSPTLPGVTRRAALFVDASSTFHLPLGSSPGMVSESSCASSWAPPALHFSSIDSGSGGGYDGCSGDGAAAAAAASPGAESSYSGAWHRSGGSRSSGGGALLSVRAAVTRKAHVHGSVQAAAASGVHELLDATAGEALRLSGLVAHLQRELCSARAELAGRDAVAKLLRGRLVELAGGVVLVGKQTQQHGEGSGQGESSTLRGFVGASVDGGQGSSDGSCGINWSADGEDVSAQAYEA